MIWPASGQGGEGKVSDGPAPARPVTKNVNAWRRSGQTPMAGPRDGQIEPKLTFDPAVVAAGTFLLWHPSGEAGILRKLAATFAPARSSNEAARIHWARSRRGRAAKVDAGDWRSRP
jgi:hypothetical protein